MTTFKRAAILIIFLLISSSVNAQSFMTEEGDVEFTSSVPLHTFTGTSSQLNGLIDFDKNLVDFYIDLQTLDTGNGRRDQDMYSTLNVEDHPFAEFTGELTTEFNQNSETAQNVSVEGDFTVNGVTREISVDGELTLNGDVLKLSAGWIINITDYDIEPPGILFYKVDEEMDIEIEAELMQQSNE
ncbi:MAG TPA: YceI family protein [Balneolaceae bacterium]|nr:YceI family protein [Balneolaceae bacterium]